jgi:hypothetical protein
MGETSILAGRRRPLLLFARRMSVRGVVPAYVSLREDIALQRRLSQLSYIVHDANSNRNQRRPPLGQHPLWPRVVAFSDSCTRNCSSWDGQSRSDRRYERIFTRTYGGRTVLLALALIEDGIPIIGILGCPNMPTNTYTSSSTSTSTWSEDEIMLLTRQRRRIEKTKCMMMMMMMIDHLHYSQVCQNFFLLKINRNEALL